MSLFTELKRRNVFRIGIAYTVAAWLLLQITDVVTPILELPTWIPKAILLLIAIGFIPALIVAWAFELTPEGVKREADVDRSKSITTQTGRKLDRAIIVVLVFALGYFIYESRFSPDQTPHPPDSIIPDRAQRASGTHSEVTGTDEARAPGEAGAVEGTSGTDAAAPPSPKTIAVLPFVIMSNGHDDDYFADGLTEEIINALAQLPELMVTARTSAFHFKGQDLPIGQIAGTLGVDHVVEGSVRREGSRLRVTAQLIRAEDGFHLWSESYDRSTDDTFAVQEDIAEKIALALEVVMDAKRRQLMRSAGVRNVEAFIAYQKGVELYRAAHGELDQISTLRRANEYFDQAIALYPEFAIAFVRHSDYYSHILLADAAGILDPNINAEDLKQAPAALLADYRAAIIHAPDDNHRFVAELDSDLLAGNWRGISPRLDRVFRLPGCTTGLWIQIAGASFGKAEAQREAYQRAISCDPISAFGWLHMVRAMIWNGEFEAAADKARAGLEIVSSEWLLGDHAKALAAAGRFEEAESVIDSGFKVEKEQLHTRIMVASLKGDAKRAEKLHDDFLHLSGPDDYNSILFTAWRGDRYEANRLAAKMDKFPIGPFELMITVYWCVCGAPFDLEATPVFAEKIAESGLPWPPAKPIDFPLKTW
jgi:TolB-like protein